MVTNESRHVKGLPLEHSAWPLSNPHPHVTQEGCCESRFTEEETETERSKVAG